MYVYLEAFAKGWVNYIEIHNPAKLFPERIFIMQQTCFHLLAECVNSVARESHSTVGLDDMYVYRPIRAEQPNTRGTRTMISLRYT